MCGIAGIVYKKNNFNKEHIKVLTDTIAHRGPDAEGFYFHNNLALGHRRLSILDLSPLANQPMSYNGKNGQYVIVYNGEIYNYLELKNTLIQNGYTFKTNTDTEVILAAYDFWGKDCLNHFNGMWAFVIYDINKNYLFASRDRFGVKPFYFIDNSEVFAFASEIKALIKLPFYHKDINEDILFDYLLLGFEEQDKSIFKGINELFPSHNLIFNMSDYSISFDRYYQLYYNNRYEKFNKQKLDEFAQQTKQLIYNAVKLRLRSDVPVGSCLSGGMDSSAIVCIINNLTKNEIIPQIGFKQKVFTATYPKHSIDESKYAEIVVKNTNTQWFKTYPTGESLLADLQDLVYYQDVPFGSTSIYSQYKVMELVKQNNVKVLLDGQGGDELFSGYVKYYPVFFKEIFYHLDFKTLLSEFRSLHNSPINATFLLSNFFEIFFKDLIPSKLAPHVYFFSKSKSKYFRKDFLKQHKDRLAYHIEKFPNSLNENLYQFMTGRNLAPLLRYEDRNSMRFSIESRTPFADDLELIEYVFKIPSAYKIHKGWSKFIFREAMKNVVPTEIIYRTSKIGFATPEKEWLIEKKDLFVDLLKKNKPILEKYFDLQNVLADFENNSIFNIKFLPWKIINFVLWSKIFFS